MGSFSFRWIMPLAAILCFQFVPVSAQGGRSDDWDVTVPRGELRQIDFKVDEGTWMSVDISPEGDWVVFDLVGHIYRVDSSGGEAVSLTQDSGVAMNYHPRISPDGTEIAFISDRGGQDNLWIMKADGSEPRLIHEDMDARFAEPAWSPDGRYVAVTRREKSPTGFYRTHDVLWLFPREGGDGFEVVRLGTSGASTPARSGVWSGPDRAQWPSFTPDGHYLYFHSSIFAGSERRLRRLDLRNGRIESVTPGHQGYLSCCGRPAYPLRLGEVAPEVSPDGRWLAFARKLPGGKTSFRGKEYVGRTALWLRDLRTGEERAVMDPISNTLAEHHPSWHVRVLPGYSWARDGKSLVISQGGKIRRLWVEDGRVETIPFRARVRRTISEAARNRHAISGDRFQVRVLRWPVSSPDGKNLVFEAVGKLWLLNLDAGGHPRPLTADSPAFQLTPDWSPDGRWLTYATWEDGVGGHIWKVAPGHGEPLRLTEKPATYLNPHWTADGSSIVASHWPEPLSPMWNSPQWELIRLSADGGSTQVLTPAALPFESTLSGEDRASFLLGGNWASVSLVDGAQKTEAHVDPRALSAVPSPDGRWLALEYEEDIYLLPMPPASFAGRAPHLDIRASGRRLSLEGGAFPHWRNDRVLEFVGANRYVTYDIESEELHTLEVDLQIKRHVGEGTLALQGARLVTLSSAGVIEAGTIVVKDGRISCAGDCDISTADRVIDMAGKTITPGWVDVHAHHLAEDGRTGIIPQHRSTSAAYLAYGVTTTHDPAARPIHSFEIGEMIEAGRIVGPRSFSTGPPLTCGPSSPLRQIRTFQDAREHINRLANLGAISIKDYKQCTRLQRTWLAQAARDRGVTLTSEGSDMNYFVGLIMTGHAGWEHPLQYIPVYADITTFFGQAGAHYSAQLLMSDYPTGNAIEYWFGQSDLWQDEKVQRWSPWQETAARRSFVKKPVNEYMFPILAEAAADMKHAGGYLAVGAHGEQDGLGTHWEVWAYAFGLTPLEALQAACQDGAHFLGLDQVIGSLEDGKLADLVVLNSNPLDNIRNTTDISYVMKAGRLYEAESLEEVWPESRPYGVRPWADEDILRRDVRGDDYWDEGKRR